MDSPLCLIQRGRKPNSDVWYNSFNVYLFIHYYILNILVFHFLKSLYKCSFNSEKCRTCNACTCSLVISSCFFSVHILTKHEKKRLPQKFMIHYITIHVLYLIYSATQEKYWVPVFSYRPHIEEHYWFFWFYDRFLRIYQLFYSNYM